MATKAKYFGARLAERIAKYGPLCVGLDPGREVLDVWKQPQSAIGLGRFMDDVIGRLSMPVAAIKLQVAFFERFGASGWMILEDSIRELRGRGFLVILDAKRNDVGSTVEGYAEAYFGDGPLRIDAITVSPYLGLRALWPLFEAADRLGCGTFVLCRTSNLDAQELQNHGAEDGQFLWRKVQDSVASLNSGSTLGSIGLVMGATLRDKWGHLDAHNGPILVPGFGYQGGTTTDYVKSFGDVRDSTLASYSRSLLFNGPASFAESVYREADSLYEAMKNG